MNNTTNIIGGVVLVIIMAGVGVLYYADVGGALLSSASLPGGSTATTSSATGPERDQTLQRLNRLEDIDIQTEFLSGQIFTGFENFGIAIQSQPVGRDNPFTPPQVQIPATITENQVDFSSTSTPPRQQNANSEATTATNTSTTSIDELPSTDNATSTGSATTTTSATSS